MLQQANDGKTFTPDQLLRLERIRDTIAACSPSRARSDGLALRRARRLPGKAYELFGDGLDPLLDELTETLAA